MYKILWALVPNLHQKYLEDLMQGSKLVAGQGHTNEVQTPQSGSLAACSQREHRECQKVLGWEQESAPWEHREGMGEEGWSKEGRTKCKEAERTQWIPE